MFSTNQHATPSRTMSGFFSHTLLTEALKRPLKSRKKNGSECSCLRRDEQASKNSSNSAEGLDKSENEADLQSGSITMVWPAVSTKWEALGQGGAKSQERPREATGCAKELQSVSWGCKGCKQARKILSAQTDTVAFLNDKLVGGCNCKGCKQASSRAFRCEK